MKANAQPHKYPRWVEFVESLPKTATGKIQRYTLHRRAAGRGKWGASLFSCFRPQPASAGFVPARPHSRPAPGLGQGFSPGADADAPPSPPPPLRPQPKWAGAGGEGAGRGGASSAAPA